MNVEKNQQPLEPSPALEVGSQNWAGIISGGVIAVVMVVVVVNVLALPGDDKFAAFFKPHLIQMGQIVGIGLSLGGGSWLLWRLFRVKNDRLENGPPINQQQAVTYIYQIEKLLGAEASGYERHLLSQIQVWWQTITAMSQALSELNQHDSLIQHDLQQLPLAIAELKAQVEAETNPLLKADLCQILSQRQNQQQALAELQITRRRAEIQIERAIAVLGTIYSQLLTYRSTSQVIDYRQLADNVAEEIQSLEDHLQALQEVKNSRLYVP